MINQFKFENSAQRMCRELSSHSRAAEALDKSIYQAQNHFMRQSYLLEERWGALDYLRTAVGETCWLTGPRSDRPADREYAARQCHKLTMRKAKLQEQFDLAVLGMEQNARKMHSWRAERLELLAQQQEKVGAHAEVSIDWEWETLIAELRRRPGFDGFRLEKLPIHALSMDVSVAGLQPMQAAGLPLYHLAASDISANEGVLSIPLALASVCPLQQEAARTIAASATFSYEDYSPLVSRNLEVSYWPAQVAAIIQDQSTSGVITTLSLWQLAATELDGISIVQPDTTLGGDRERLQQVRFRILHRVLTQLAGAFDGAELTRRDNGERSLYMQSLQRSSVCLASPDSCRIHAWRLRDDAITRISALPAGLVSWHESNADQPSVRVSTILFQ